MEFTYITDRDDNRRFPYGHARGIFVTLPAQGNPGTTVEDALTNIHKRLQSVDGVITATEAGLQLQYSDEFAVDNQALTLQYETENIDFTQADFVKVITE